MRIQQSFWKAVLNKWPHPGPDTAREGHAQVEKRDLVPNSFQQTENEHGSRDSSVFLLSVQQIKNNTVFEKNLCPIFKINFASLQWVLAVHINLTITTILEIKTSSEYSFVLRNAVPPISIPILPFYPTLPNDCFYNSHTISLKHRQAFNFFQFLIKKLWGVGADNDNPI